MDKYPILVATKESIIRDIPEMVGVFAELSPAKQKILLAKFNDLNMERQMTEFFLNHGYNAKDLKDLIAGIDAGTHENPFEYVVDGVKDDKD